MRLNGLARIQSPRRLAGPLHSWRTLTCGGKCLGRSAGLVIGCALMIALFACGKEGGKSKKRTVEYTISNVDVYLEWDATEGDHEVQDVRYILDRMAELLYGAIDGQIRIAQFTLYDSITRPAAEAPGTFHFHDPWPHGGAVGLASLGTPANPGKIHLGRSLIDSHGGLDPHEHYAYTALMEFSHAYFSARDEYDSKCPDNAFVACPLEHNIGSISRSNADMNRFCGPANWGLDAHFSGSPLNGQEAAHGMSCYEWIAKIVKTDTGKTIKIPSPPFGKQRVPRPALWVLNLL